MIDACLRSISTTSSSAQQARRWSLLLGSRRLWAPLATQATAAIAHRQRSLDRLVREVVTDVWYQRLISFDNKQTSSGTRKRKEPGTCRHDDVLERPHWADRSRHRALAASLTRRHPDWPPVTPTGDRGFHPSPSNGHAPRLRSEHRILPLFTCCKGKVGEERIAAQRPGPRGSIWRPTVTVFSENGNGLGRSILMSGSEGGEWVDGQIEPATLAERSPRAGPKPLRRGMGLRIRGRTRT